MSRLCRNNMIDNPREYSEKYFISAFITEKFKVTPNQQRVIASVHNSFVGHFGLERTLKRLKKLVRHGSFNDNMLDTLLMDVLVVRRCLC